MNEYQEKIIAGSPMLQKAAALQVEPINMEKLTEVIAREAPEHFKENEVPHIGALAVVTGADGKKSIIDTGCVGREGSLAVDVWAKGKRGEGYYYTRAPVCRCLFSLEELPLLPPTTLLQFMGDRFAYNDRIECNISIWMKALS